MRRGWIARCVVGGIILLVLGLYAYFFWQTQLWTGFNPDYVQAYRVEGRDVSAGSQMAATGLGAGAPVCNRSAIAEVGADLTDLNANQNAWLAAMLLYQLSLFVLTWGDAPFFDDKASFHGGAHPPSR